MTARAPRSASNLLRTVYLLQVLCACGAGVTGEPAKSQPSLLVEAQSLAGLQYATFVTGGTNLDGLPILVVLHSMGAGPEEFAPLFSRLGVHARVVLPRGPEQAFDGFAWWPASAYRSEATDNHALEESSDVLAHFIVAAQRRYHSKDPVVVSGMSQGGDLSFVLGLRYPELVRAALPMSGRIPSKFWLHSRAQKNSVIDAFHGRADRKAPFENTANAIQHLREDGVPIAMHVYEGLDHDTSAIEENDVLACAERRLLGNMASDACSSPVITP